MSIFVYKYKKPQITSAKRNIFKCVSLFVFFNSATILNCLMTMLISFYYFPIFAKQELYFHNERIIK